MQNDDSVSWRINAKTEIDRGRGRNATEDLVFLQKRERRKEGMKE
jgi:hypothetical protein